MREILFRGKCKETRMWVYGNFIKVGRIYNYIYPKSDSSIFVFDNFVEVIPKTVTQFTGKFDEKNNRKVFEGDQYKIDRLIYTVEFIRYEFKLTNPKTFSEHLGLNYTECSDVEFIGNIFEREEGEKWE